MQFVHLSSIDEMIESRLEDHRRACQTAARRGLGLRWSRTSRTGARELSLPPKSQETVFFGRFQKEVENFGFEAKPCKGSSISCLETQILPRRSLVGRERSTEYTLEDILDNDLFFVERPFRTQAAALESLQSQGSSQMAPASDFDIYFVKAPFDASRHFFELSEGICCSEDQSNLIQDPATHPPVTPQPQPIWLPQGGEADQLLEESFADSSVSSSSEDSSSQGPPSSFKDPQPSENDYLGELEPSQRSSGGSIGEGRGGKGPNTKKGSDKIPSLRDPEVQNHQPKNHLNQHGDTPFRNKETKESFLWSSGSPQPQESREIQKILFCEVQEIFEHFTRPLPDSSSNLAQSPALSPEKSAEKDQKFCQQPVLNFGKKRVFVNKSTKIEFQAEKGGRETKNKIKKKVKDTKKDKRVEIVNFNSKSPKTSIALRD